MKKLFIFLFVFLLLVPVIYAAKVDQTFIGGSTGGLEIRVPQAEFIEQDLDVTSHIHVYNKSSGFLMTNETTSCLIHIYNQSGDHIAEEDYGFDDNNIDFEVDINGNNFSGLGFHSFLIQCNTSDEGGFVAGSVEVTPDGKALEEYNNFSFAIAAIIFMFITTLVVVGLFKSKKVWLKVVLTIALSITLTTLLRFASWFITITNPSETVLIKSLDFFYSIGVRSMYFLIAGAMIFLVVLIINSIRDMPRERRKRDWENWGKDE